MNKKISIIVSFYNEEANIKTTVEKLSKELNKISEDHNVSCFLYDQKSSP